MKTGSQWVVTRICVICETSWRTVRSTWSWLIYTLQSAEPHHTGTRYP